MLLTRGHLLSNRFDRIGKIGQKIGRTLTAKSAQENLKKARKIQQTRGFRENRFRSLFSFRRKRSIVLVL